jgi:hypothetical protein
MLKTKLQMQKIAYAVVLCMGLIVADGARAQILQISADKVADLLGEPSSPYSFFAVQNGKLEPVPHQWMRFTQNGYPAFTSDPETEREPHDGQIRGEDRLLLRREDGGPPLDEAPRMGNLVGELVVDFPDETLVFYVMKNAYRQATKRYVKFNREQMVIKSTDYSLSMAPDNMLIWRDFHYRGYEHPSGERQSILDSLKIRMGAGLFTRDNRITMTNRNLDPTIESIVRGPLAWAIHATTRVKVAGVTVLKINNYFLIMPTQTDIHSRFTLPGVARTVINNPSLSISLDGNKLLGGKLKTSWTGDLMAEVDGRISEEEEQMRGAPLEKDNWVWFSSGRGFDVLARLAFRDGASVPAHLLYQDSLTRTNKPERFPGQLPNVGFTMNELPIGEEFYFLTRLYFSADSEGMNANHYADHILAEPKILFQTAGQ